MSEIKQLVFFILQAVGSGFASFLKRCAATNMQTPIPQAARREELTMAGPDGY